MEKDQKKVSDDNDLNDDKSELNNESKNQNQTDLDPKEKIKELEDKLTRNLAEMENQRRRFEKEKKRLSNTVDLILQQNLFP
mgnify:CR=1 FL=1